MSKHPIVSPTYRKRTDHGDHGRRNRAAAGPITCPDCGAFYFRRRWIRSEDPLAIAQIGLPTGIKRCPACEAERQARPSGVLTVAGRFFEQHTADIEALLRGEADRAADDNPTARIIRWDVSKPGVLTVWTSTEHLVERLGRALKHAFHGEIDYDFAHDEKFARVEWRRDA